MLERDMETVRATLALSFTPGLGPVRFKALLEHFGSSRAALEAGLTALREVPGLDAGTVAGIGAKESLERADTELERARRVSLEVIAFEDDRYPEALRAIYDPPPALWLRGDTAALEHLRGPTPRAIGVVGTRKCSSHARIWTAGLARDLAVSGVTVISGLARGIDTEAHRAALDAGGLSIGVLGCGADRIYPPENAELAARMAVISAYPVGTPPTAHHFPARNRIIAGLCSGVVVVEGDVKSGSLITALAALEAGRTVFAVPGRPNDPNAHGPHRLIRDGAVLTESAQDVLEELGWASGPPRETPKLEGHEARVYAVLEGTPLLDEIVAGSGLSAPEALTALTMLSLQGVVRELPGGRYSKA
jgi:DNA processing protein